MLRRKLIKIGTSTSDISLGFRNGFVVPFTSLSRPIGFKFGIRTIVPEMALEMG